MGMAILKIFFLYSCEQAGTAYTYLSRVAKEIFYTENTSKLKTPGVVLFWDIKD